MPVIEMEILLVLPSTFLLLFSFPFYPDFCPACGGMAFDVSRHSSLWHTEQKLRGVWDPCSSSIHLGSGLILCQNKL